MTQRKDQDMVMRRVWLAAVLGVVVGFGIAVFPTSIGSEEKAMLPLTAMNQPQGVQAATPPSQQLMYLLVGLIVGVVVATPVFLLTKSRFR